MLAAAAALLLSLCGCVRNPAPVATPSPTPSPTARQEADPLSLLTGAYLIEGGAETLESGSYDSSLADEAAVLVCGGTLTGTSIQIDKTGDTGDAADALAYGYNAAITVCSLGSAALEDALLVTNGLGAAGVFVSGEGSSATLTGGLLSTAGDDSPGVVASDGASVALESAEVLADGAGSPGLLVRGGASLTAAGTRCKASSDACLSLDGASATLTNCTMIGAGLTLGGGATLRMEGGSLAAASGDALLRAVSDASLSLVGVALELPSGGALLRVDGGTLALLCDYQSLSGTLLCGADAALTLTLQNNSSYTGSLPVESRLPVTLTLDATSHWFVTGDSFLMALADTDAALQNIESNGFTVYYDAAIATNAWLGGETHALPGGGSLTPLA